MKTAKNQASILNQIDVLKLHHIQGCHHLVPCSWKGFGLGTFQECSSAGEHCNLLGYDNIYIT
jgi:hypothetical protein